jgi:hypothetical protein
MPDEDTQLRAIVTSVTRNPPTAVDPDSVIAAARRQRRRRQQTSAGLGAVVLTLGAVALLTATGQPSRSDVLVGQQDSGPAVGAAARPSASTSSASTGTWDPTTPCNADDLEAFLNDQRISGFEREPAADWVVELPRHSPSTFAIKYRTPTNDRGTSELASVSVELVGDTQRPLAGTIPVLPDQAGQVARAVLDPSALLGNATSAEKLYLRISGTVRVCGKPGAATGSFQRHVPVTITP